MLWTHYQNENKDGVVCQYACHWYDEIQLFCLKIFLIAFFSKTGCEAMFALRHTML